MTFLEVLEKAEGIVNTIDKYDDEVIRIFKETAESPYAPEDVRLAAKVLEEKEPEIIEKLLSVIKTAEKLAGKPSSAEKLSVASQLMNVPNASSIISGAVDYINSLIGKEKK